MESMCALCVSVAVVHVHYLTVRVVNIRLKRALVEMEKVSLTNILETAESFSRQQNDDM